MIQTLIKIGNSKGVLIPKMILITFGITDEDEIEVLGYSIMLRSIKKKVCDSWNVAFKQAIANGDEPENDPFKGMKNTFDEAGWTW